ncbi:MAG: Fic family protein [Deltaproteobacteria bacterium]|jgi:Fic family protein|nr:Fic family protein [Deltaproteobacteria bacterium]MBT4661703.1 Fic family protein [Candidatus Neomarinimicrobiota bacterium]
MITEKYWNIKPDKEKALMLAQREIAVFVQDAILLEGLNFTLPEIQTLLEGITVGGHKLGDQQIAVNQGHAWKFLFSALKNNSFTLSVSFVCELHAIAALEEALKWGEFRTSGVTIAGTDYLPPDAIQLTDLFEKLRFSINKIQDIYDRAIYVFLVFAKNQFFFDVNKRMGRFMMNGILLSSGYPAINLPAKRKLEFNELMLSFYQTDDSQPMIRFMRSCLDLRLIKNMSSSK